MAAGRPVIAYAKGGAMETVVEGKTGIFFDEYSVEGLKKALHNFKFLIFNFKTVINSTKRFSKKRFVEKMGKVISSAIKLKNA